MGLLCEFDVCADFGFIESTDEFGIIPDYSEGNAVFCETFMSVSQSIVPVDTGYLQSTLTADCGDTDCWAETDCEYAQYVEFGTWKQGAQPYFEPAVAQAISAAAPYWGQAQEAALLEEEQLMEEMQQEQQRQQMAAQAASQQSSFGSNMAQMGGMLLGGIIVAIITTFIHELIGFAFTDDRSSSGGGGSSSGHRGGGGEGSVYVPDIIVT